jgi:hypothetical protein
LLETKTERKSKAVGEPEGDDDELLRVVGFRGPVLGAARRLVEARGGGEAEPVTAAFQLG